METDVNMVKNEEREREREKEKLLNTVILEIFILFMSF